MDPGITQAIEIGLRLAPSVIGLIKGLIEAGMSPEDAEAVVRKDLESRRAAYEKAKADDETALAIKHGVGSNPFDADDA